MSQYLYELEFYDKLKIANRVPPFNQRPIPQNNTEFWDFFIKWGSNNYPSCNFNL